MTVNSVPPPDAVSVSRPWDVFVLAATGGVAGAALIAWVARAWLTGGGAR